MPAVRRNYDSGEDYLLEYGDLRFSYSETDYFERVDQAARQLNLVTGPLTHEELEDLVELVTEGLPPASPRSDLGEHLHRNWPHFVLVKPGPVNWLRRLVFRQSWLDQRVLDGELDVRLTDPATGRLEYLDPKRPREPIVFAKHPDYTAIAYTP